MSAGLCALFSGCRSSHLLEPTQLLIGQLAGSGEAGPGIALSCQRWTRQALYLKTPGGGVGEKRASPGQGSGGGPLPAWSLSLGRSGSFHALCHMSGSPFAASLGRALAHVLFLNEKAGIPSHCSLMVSPTKSTGHGVGRAVYRALRPPCLWALLIRKKVTCGWPDPLSWLARCPCRLKTEREGHSQGSEPSRPLSFSWAGLHFCPSCLGGRGPSGLEMRPHYLERVKLKASGVRV